MVFIINKCICLFTASVSTKYGCKASEVCQHMRIKINNMGNCCKVQKSKQEQELI